MKKINYKWFLLIFILFIGCEEDSDDFDPETLSNGTYYQVGDDYVYLEILNSGSTIKVYVNKSQPNSYCKYTKTGVLTSSSSTGLDVDGKWFTFLSSDNYCFDYRYTVVQQKDKNTIEVRRSSYDYEFAYSYGCTLTFTK